MKVLHFVSTLSRNSGVMRVIMNYYKHIDRSDIQFDFLYFSKSEDSYQEEIESLGGNVYYVPKPGASLRAWKELALFFNKHGYQYTWLHNHENYLTVFLYPLAKKYGIRNFAVHAHLTRYSDKKISAIRNAVFCFPIRFLPVHRVACSKAAGNFLFGDKADVFLMCNAIDCKAFQFDEVQRKKIREQYAIPENAFVIGHVGRMVPQKNHEFLLKVFSEYLKKDANSLLLLVGSGPMEDSVKRLAEEYGIQENIRFAGQQQVVTPYLSAMDAFVLPSLFEGLPMVAVEAQANGLPCFLADTITRETAFQSNVRFCSINSTASWLKMLANQIVYKNEDRKLDEDTYNKMDIRKYAANLQQFYYEM